MLKKRIMDTLRTFSDPSLSDPSLLLRLAPRPTQGIPSACLVCAQKLRNEQICSGCQLQLPYLDEAQRLCQSCALPLSGTSPYCGRCLSAPPAFECCRIPFRYDYPLKRLIQRFKYRGQLAYGRLLAEQMLAYLQTDWRQQAPLAETDWLIPVPMHWSRRLKRGFNQTELLARDLAGPLGLTVHTGLCRRQRPTQPQEGLSRRERQQNLRRAFTLCPGAGAQLEGRSLVILDDVVTTGSTVRELSRLMMAAGASRVEVWALARTPE